MQTRRQRDTKAEKDVAAATALEVEPPKKRGRIAAPVVGLAAAVVEVIDVDQGDGDDNDDDDDDEDDNDNTHGAAAAAADVDNDTIDEWGIALMDVPTMKGMLKERNLSINGDKKVLAKRLVGRLHKEKNPDYKPKPIGRSCKWCGAQMKKRRSFKNEFYGCVTWPACQYTTSLSGYARPNREHLRGVPGAMHGRDYRYYERMY